MSKRRKELRSEMRRILANLDRRWLEAASHDLSRELTRLVDEQIGGACEHLLVWAAFFPGEVDLTLFVEGQLGRRTVYMPRTLPDRSMQFISIDAQWRDRAETSELGIPEPREGQGVSYDPRHAERTVVVVPGLAFDKRGGRLGRGGGYYDRFLGRVALQRATKVGVGWSLQIVDVVPTEAHDVAMDWVCFERGVLECAAVKEAK